MAWIATDKDGKIYIYTYKPVKEENEIIWRVDCEDSNITQIRPNMANLLTDNNIPSWEDEPVQIGVIND